MAVEARIDNWRWAGVPFYMRTGKRMPARVTEIAVTFKLPPLNLFTTIECDGNLCGLAETRPNTLLFRIQPKESIRVSFCTAKRPGMQYQVQPVDMEFDYSNFEIDLPEAYERLLLDAMRGDSTLFTRSDELEAAWKFCEPMLQAWELAGPPSGALPGRHPGAPAWRTSCSSGPAASGGTPAAPRSKGPSAAALGEG